MKHLALVFLLAILLPAILLAVLAVRSLQDQEWIVNSQRTQLHQSHCDTVADRINLFMNDLRVFYGQVIDELVTSEGEALQRSFDELLGARWGQVAGGVVVQEDGQILSSPKAGSRSAHFLEEHADFLTNRRVVEVYQAPRLLGAQIEVDSGMERKIESKGKVGPNRRKVEESGKAAFSEADPAVQSVAPLSRSRGVNAMEGRSLGEMGSARRAAPLVTEESASSRVASSPSAAPLMRKGDELTLPEIVVPSMAPALAESELGAPKLSPLVAAPELPKRKVAPTLFRSASARLGEQEVIADTAVHHSAVSPESVQLQQLTASESEGAVSRLIEGELHVLLWKRHPLQPELTYWAGLDLAAIREDLIQFVTHPPVSRDASKISFVLLNHSGDPVGQSRSEFSADGQQPFVASEIGPILPRWKVAAFLLDPSSLGASARKMQLTLGFLIFALLGAVAIGGVLILRSVNDEIRIATQKTDFVSNVSHELKTPLTSIRMFSELLRDAPRHDPEKTRQYSDVISKESARLTRLINRLLDFSRLERGEMPIGSEALDFSKLILETVENYRPHLEFVGLELKLLFPEGDPMIVIGDRDALAQVVLNLLSNAEKYAAEGGLVTVEVSANGERMVRLAVSDQGPGIPRSLQRHIFDKFYRVDDSITSGIEGSGIGLALSRQIVELHGGTIRCESTRGVGTSFLIDLPLDPA